MNAETFNRHLEHGRRQADEQLDKLADGYRISLQTAGSKAADRFTKLATSHLTADATNPGWTPPENQELVDKAELQRDARKRTAAAQKAALRAVVAPAANELGISFDLANPLAIGLLAGSGVRAQDLDAAIADQIASAILSGYQQGLSVVDTAALIKQAAWDIAAPRAMMLARTHLNGIANGGSILAARLVNDTSGPDEPQVGYKQWLATEDERTRESHAEADGQVVPIDQPFQVGGEQADYPGDPDLSDEEACNCRCTVVFVDAAGGAAAEAEMPIAASSREPTDDVALAGPVTTSLQDPLAAAVTVTVDDAAEAPAAGAAPVAWRALLCVEGEPSQDGPSLVRMLAPGGGTWRELPLPLGVMYDTPHSDGANAVVCGRIDEIWRDTAKPNEIWGAGVFNTDAIGQRASEMVGNLSLRGVSIDPYVATLEIVEPTEDYSGDSIEVQPTLMTFAEYVIGGATICPFQALERATISLVENDDGTVESAQVVTASCFLLSRVDVEAGPSALEVLATVSEAERMAALERSIGAVSDLVASVQSLHASVTSLEQRTAQKEAKDAAIVAAIQELAARDASLAGLPEALAASAAQGETLAVVAENQQRLSIVTEGVASQLVELVASVGSIPDHLRGEREARERGEAALADKIDGLGRVADALVASVKTQQPRRALHVIRDEQGRPVRYESEDSEA